LMTSLMTLCTDLAFDMGWQGPLGQLEGTPSRVDFSSYYALQSS
jgi:hypothetical protein